MPHAYTQRDLTRVYEEIAIERTHICSGCEKPHRPLSHSHLIPRSRRPDLATNKEIIVYHCLSLGGQGCHEKYEGMMCVMLNDFENNFRIIYKVDPEYFWARVFKLKDHWTNVATHNLIPNYPPAVALVDRIVRLITEIQAKENG